MSNLPPADLAYQAAVRKVQRKLHFFSHLMIFVMVNCMLVAINLLTTPQRIWAFWPIFGWGIGVAMHGLQVFFADQHSQLQKRMIEKELLTQRSPHQ